MVSREQVRRRQVAVLTLLGGVGGPLLLAIAEMWVSYLFMVIVGLALRGGGGMRIIYPIDASLWLHSFPMAFTSSAAVVYLAGPLLGSFTTWGWLRHKPEPLLVGQFCVRWGIRLLIMIVLWRLLLVFGSYKYYQTAGMSLVMRGNGPKPLVPMNAGPLVHSLWTTAFDPALLWSFCLWYWGVQLRRQGIKEGYAEGNEV